MNPETRAQISRENGAKSKGPVTPEGKAASSQNAALAAERASQLAHFLPPHHAVACNESREAFDAHIEELTQIYRPANPIAVAIVREIATANWQIERLHHCLTFQWNVAIVNQATQPATLAPELLEVETMARAAEALYTSGAVAHRLNRQIDQLHIRIARLERRLKFLNANFPAESEAGKVEKNEPEVPQPEKVEKNEPAAPRPESVPQPRIVPMPPGNVALGIESKDNPPTAPRINPKRAA